MYVCIFGSVFSRKLSSQQWLIFTKYIISLSFSFDTRDEKVIYLMQKKKKQKWSEETARTKAQFFINQITESVLWIFVYKSFLLRQPTNQQKKKKTHTNFFFNLCVIHDDVKFHWAA